MGTLVHYAQTDREQARWRYVRRVCMGTLVHYAQTDREGAAGPAMRWARTRCTPRRATAASRSSSCSRPSTPRRGATLFAHSVPAYPCVHMASLDCLLIVHLYTTAAAAALLVAAVQSLARRPLTVCSLIVHPHKLAAPSFLPWPLVPCSAQPECSLTVHTYTLAASSTLAWPLVPALFAHSEAVCPYT